MRFLRCVFCGHEKRHHPVWRKFPSGVAQRRCRLCDHATGLRTLYCTASQDTDFEETDEPDPERFRVSQKRTAERT